MYLSNKFIFSQCFLSFLQISGVLRNTGQTVVFTAEKGVRVNVSGASLAYRYQFEELYIHYGPEDLYGSEHLVENIPFPAEVSSILLLGF